MPSSWSFAPGSGHQGRPPASPPPPSAPAPANHEVPFFDPAEHTVDEVKAFVTEYPTMASAILEAEQAGKARVTLVEWLEGPQSGDAGV